MKYSTVYQNIDPSTIAANKKLVKSGFWKKEMPDSDKSKICKTWLIEVSHIYKVQVPDFRLVQSQIMYRQTGGGLYEPASDRITLFEKFSLVTLLHEFRHHLQHQKGRNMIMYKRHVEEDARAWSVSLFKLSTPEAYKKAVSNKTLRFD